MFATPRSSAHTAVSSSLAAAARAQQKAGGAGQGGYWPGHRSHTRSRQVVSSPASRANCHDGKIL